MEPSGEASIASPVGGSTTAAGVKRHRWSANKAVNRIKSGDGDPYNGVAKDKRVVKAWASLQKQAEKYSILAGRDILVLESAPSGIINCIAIPENSVLYQTAFADSVISNRRRVLRVNLDTSAPTDSTRALTYEETVASLEKHQIKEIAGHLLWEHTNMMVSMRNDAKKKSEGDLTDDFRHLLSVKKLNAKWEPVTKRRWNIGKTLSPQWWDENIELTTPDVSGGRKILMLGKWTDSRIPRYHESDRLCDFIAKSAFEHDEEAFVKAYTFATRPVRNVTSV